MTYLKLLLMIAVSVLVVHCGGPSSSGTDGGVDPATLSENLQKADCLKGVYKGNADVDDNIVTALTTTDDSIVTISINHNGKSGAEEEVIFYVESEDDEGEAFCSVYGGLSYTKGSADDPSVLTFTTGASKGAVNNRGAVQPELGFNETGAGCSFEDLHITDDVNTAVNDNLRPQRVRSIEKQEDQVASFAELKKTCDGLTGEEDPWYNPLTL